MADDPTLESPASDDHAQDVSAAGSPLEAFSAAAATGALDRDLAGVSSIAEARPILTRHAQGLLPQIEMIIRRHRKALHTIEVTKRYKVANCWRACALGLINQIEGEGGALPVFAGHADFVNNLRTALQEAEDLRAFTDLLAEEEKRWRRSMFGRKKVQLIEIIREQMRSRLEGLIKKTRAQVEKALEPRVQQQHRNYELEVGSLASWYRHLIGAPMAAAGPAGVDLRWQAISTWEQALVARISQVRSNQDACLELGRVWNHIDQEVSTSFKDHVRQLRLEGGSSAERQRQLIRRELEAMESYRDSLVRYRQQLETRSEALDKLVTKAISGINALPQSQLRQFVDLAQHRSVKNLTDLFTAVKSANHLQTSACKTVFDVLAALEPFRAVRFKIRRSKAQIEAHREAFSRYLDDGPA